VLDPISIGGDELHCKCPKCGSGEISNSEQIDENKMYAFCGVCGHKYSVGINCNLDQ
jgi:transcription elongation factor Elf1